MNEVSAELIAQATEEVVDVTENVESIDAPPVSELVEQVTGPGHSDRERRAGRADPGMKSFRPRPCEQVGA